MSNNAHDLSNRLLNALDNNYNVVDMHTVNEIISILEKINITKELLETTRLGKHVNELRRRTSDPSLARRAKVLVKRWRDLVIPTVASPGHTGSNRSSAERQVRRLGGTPLTSPALCRVVSPAVNSPRPPSRPAWGGYESDSQDVILVDDDPPPPLHPPPPAPLPAPANALKPLTSPVKRPISPVPLHDEKKAKRDKKPKKRRGHSRAGSGTEATAEARPAAPPPPPPPPAGPQAGAGGAWAARNGSANADRKRNGYRRDTVDPYAAMVNRMPPAGAKKVKTTKELLEEIQSRGSRVPASPSPPASPASPDVMLIEPDSVMVKAESPLRNGDREPRVPSPAPPSPRVPLEDEREYVECTCGEGEEGAEVGEGDEGCPARGGRGPQPVHVRALHHALLPGVNGTRAPRHPHRYAVRPPTHPDDPTLFASVVPLYKYSDYADDYLAKNMSRVPLCLHIPWTEFAPAPPSPPPPPSPPSPRPYPIDPVPDDVKIEAPESNPPSPETDKAKSEPVKIEAEMVGVPSLEPSERLKAPLLSDEEETHFGRGERNDRVEVADEFKSEQREHRTVERTKTPPLEELDGRALATQCLRARTSIPYDYCQLLAAPELTLRVDDDNAEDRLEAALDSAEAATERDQLGRPARHSRFTEWHECARLGDLIALPYVVID